MITDVQLECDDTLDSMTIEASPATAIKVCELLGESDFKIVISPDQIDGVLKVGPNLFDAIEYMLHGFAHLTEDEEVEWDRSQLN